MKRRAFVSLLATGAVAGCIGNQGEEPEDPTPTEEVPPELEEVYNLAVDFQASIQQHYPEARVWINRDEEVVMEYQTDKDTTSEVETEFHRIADLYIEVVQDHDPATFSIVTGQVQAIIGKPVVHAYVEGNINKEAFHETIEVTSVDRN